MRIVTYNIWHEPATQHARWAALITALGRIQADLVALQEVPTGMGADGRDAAAVLADQSGYRDSYFRAYPTDPDEGLAILSRHPLSQRAADWDSPRASVPGCAIRVATSIDGRAVTLINVHLDWSSIVVREQQIVQLCAWQPAGDEPEKLCVLCGDFNAVPESSVYRFLMGQQSLAGAESLPWIDLAASHAFRLGTTAAPTLDFVTNPRWATNVRLEPSMRVDWLLLGVGPGHAVPRVQTVELVGTAPLPPTAVVPSDHYGVYTALTFDEVDGRR